MEVSGRDNACHCPAGRGVDPRQVHLAHVEDVVGAARLRGLVEQLYLSWPALGGLPPTQLLIARMPTT
jgi:hypothetical protein